MRRVWGFDRRARSGPLESSKPCWLPRGCVSPTLHHSTFQGHVCELEPLPSASETLDAIVYAAAALAACWMRDGCVMAAGG